VSAVGFAPLTSLGLILEALIGEEHLFASGEDELSSTFGAFQDLVVVFHTLLRGCTQTGRAALAQSMKGFAEDNCRFLLLSDFNLLGRTPRILILLTPLLFAETLTREGLLSAALLPRLHVVAVLFDFLDDVFRLHFTLEAAEGVL
jgi:hypothetical protein